MIHRELRPYTFIVQVVGHSSQRDSIENAGSGVDDEVWQALYARTKKRVQLARPIIGSNAILTIRGESQNECWAVGE